MKLKLEADLAWSNKRRWSTLQDTVFALMTWIIHELTPLFYSGYRVSSCRRNAYLSWRLSEGLYCGSPQHGGLFQISGLFTECRG